jgi:SAM-dependent methyltransferase
VGLQAHAEAAPEEGAWQLRYADGRTSPFALGRWLGGLDPADRHLLSCCVEPTLDVGCGPGRLVAALSEDGRSALGIDLAASAVGIARAAGAPAVHASVFDAIPAEGTWGTVLLIDGNIGIGGDPVRLLRRCRDLLGDGGRVLVELDPPGSPSDAFRVRIEAPHEHSDWFTWAHVAADSVGTPARRAGLEVLRQWRMDTRWFASLGR